MASVFIIWHKKMILNVSDAAFGIGPAEHMNGGIVIWILRAAGLNDRLFPTRQLERRDLSRIGSHQQVPVDPWAKIVALRTRDGFVVACIRTQGKVANERQQQ